MSRIVLALCVAALAADASQVTPVQKVIQMMEEMKAKGVAEMQAEEVTFTTFAGWCTNTAKQRNAAIAKGKSSIERLAAEVEKLDSDAAVLGQEIQDLDALIDTTTIEMNKANKQRGGEKKDFKVEDKQLGSTIGDVKNAIKKLDTMMKTVPGASAASLLELASTPRSAKVFASLLAREATGLDMEAPEAAEFDSQSGNIVEMATSMEHKLEDEKEGGWEEEMEQQHAFQMLEQVLKDEIEKHTRIRDSKASTKKEKEARSAEAKGELAEAKDAYAADTEYLTDLKATCEQKTVDFKARQKLRGEELEAIDKAIEIISDTAVSGAADKHLPALVQGKATPSALAQLRSGDASVRAQKVAAALLEVQSRRSGSKLLAALSVRVSEAPFGKVIKMIKDMIMKLTEEATDEAEHKGFCDTELSTNKQSRDSLSAEVAELTATIEQLSAKSTKLSQAITALSSEIAELDAAVSEATTLRADEKEKNTETIADAQGAIAAVGQALTVLKDFYAKASGATALAQLAKGVADDMPETFDKPYTGMESGGVVGMLEVCLSDFQRLEAETTETESSSAAEFQQFSNDSELDRAKKDMEVKMKTDLKQKTDSSANTAKGDLSAAQEQLDGAMAYFEKLKPSCVDAGLSYEDRVAARKEEIQSLKEALNILTP